MRLPHLTGFAALAVAVATLLPAGPGRAQDARKPVPAEAEVTAKIGLIRETYKADYAKKTVADKAALGTKLLQLARETKDDPVGRYALLLEARDNGARGADAITAMSAADELAADYQVKPGEVRAAAAEPLATAANSPTATLAAAQVLLGASWTARQADDWDSTLTLLKYAGVAARKAGPNGTRIANTVAVRVKEAEHFKAESVKAAAALESLKTKPDDPEANLVVGKYVFVGKEEFDDGVKYLAKGSDPKLKDAAAKDLKAEEGGAAEEIAAADAWYDLAAPIKVTDPDAMSKPAYQLRAHYWYSKAIPDADGLTRTKAESSLELAPVADARSDRGAIFVTIRKAIVEKRYRRGPHHGGGDLAFEELPPEGAYLVGFDCSTISNGNYPGIVQPIWMTARGVVPGVVYGVPRKNDKTEKPLSTRAKPGYAVGSVQLRTGLGMDQIKPVYMKLTETGVNVMDKYDGPMIGGMGGGPSTNGGDGSLIIGIHGRRDRTTGKIEGMGVITLGDPTAKKKK